MPDVLIFDDDPLIGNLVGDLLRGQGFTTSYFPSAAGVLQIIQDTKPRLVLLDVMMPGMDGLTACRAIRANPATRHVKIIMLTAKDFQQDRTAAQRYGADLFINKPFDTHALGTSIMRLMGLRRDPLPGTPAEPPSVPLVMTRLEGAAVLESPDFWVVFDAGKGLGPWLAVQPRLPQHCWVLLSRYHDDTTASITALGALLGGGSRVNLAGPDESESLLQRLAPRACAALPAGQRVNPYLYPQREGEFYLASGILAVTRYTQHPGSCLAYRVEMHGRKLVYCPYHEVNPDPLGWNRHELEKFRAFFAGADLLLHGYRRSLLEPAPTDGTARGAWEPVLQLAAEAKAARLGLIPLYGAPPVDAARLSVPGSPLRAEIAKIGERYLL